jgi:CRP-like cAMP-binding protein
LRRNRQATFEHELAATTLFAALSPEQIHHLAHTATRVKEAKGTVFSMEGERGDELIVLLEGAVEVRRDDAVLARLGPGEHFGEVALLGDTARRSATVVAITPVVVAYLSRHHFDTLIATSPSIRLAVERILQQRSVLAGDPSPSAPKDQPGDERGSADSGA